MEIKGFVTEIPIRYCIGNPKPMNPETAAIIEAAKGLRGNDFLEAAFETHMAASKRVASVNQNAKHLKACKRGLSIFVGLR